MSEKQENRRARVDALANEIIKAVETVDIDGKDWMLAQEAMLLAQHRLFGVAYLHALLVGRLHNPSPFSS